MLAATCSLPKQNLVKALQGQLQKSADEVTRLTPELTVTQTDP